jgi:hypothetical protein
LTLAGAAFAVALDGCVYLPADGASVGSMPEDAGPLGQQHPLYLTSTSPNAPAPQVVPMRLTAGGTQVEPDGNVAFDLDSYDAEDTTWPLGANSTLYVRAGQFDLTRLSWRAEPSAENDGRDYTIFALRTTTGPGYLSGTRGFYDCVIANAAAPIETIVGNLCPFGRTLAPMGSVVGALIKLWRARNAPSPVPGIYSAAPLEFRNTYQTWQALVENSTAGGAAGVTGPQPFTRSLVSRTWDPATQTLGGGALEDDVRFILPLGHPSTGETKPHLYVFPTVTGVVATSPSPAALGQPGAWSEALGYDCPRVLADQGFGATSVPDPSNTAAMPPAAGATAIARHGRLAVERCIALQRCVGTTPPSTPRMCAGVVVAHVTPDATWVPRNRLYIGAPGSMVPIRRATYSERRSQYQTVAELSGSSAPEWLTHRVELRFGAGQVMMIDHLAHLLYDSAEYSSQGESSSGVVVQDGPLLTAGRAIGFIYRIEPWLVRATGNVSTTVVNGVVEERPRIPEYGNAFDWGVYDYLGTTNQFANTPRYEETNTAIGQIVPITKHLFARCPIDFMELAQQVVYRPLLGTTRTRGPEQGTPCQYAADPAYGGWPRALRDRAGTLAGQWFATDASGPRGAPMVALASEGPRQVMASFDPLESTTSIDVSFRPLGGALPMQFTTCAPDPGAMATPTTRPMPSMMNDIQCRTIATRRPEFVTAPAPGAARNPFINAGCFEAEGGSAPSGRLHARFRMINANTMEAFRGLGACPSNETAETSYDSPTPLLVEGFSEVGPEKFYR